MSAVETKDIEVLKQQYYSKKGRAHVLKRFIAEKYLRISHRSKNLIKPLELQSEDAYDAGAVANDEDAQLERPRQLSQPNAFDSVTAFGTDASDNLVYVRIDRFQQHVHADVYVKLCGDLQFYRLPSQLADQQCNTCRCYAYRDGETQFACRGLVLEMMEPFRRWKISFDGLLTQGDSEDSRNFLHVKFSFIWTPIHQPFDSRYHFNAKLLADAVAKEKWTSDLWREIQNPCVEWYDHWGCLIGTIEIGDGDAATLRLRGKKMREFGVIDLKSIYRNVSFNVYIEDGTVIHLKVESIIDKLTEYQSGYVIKCSDAYQPISETTLSLADFGEEGLFPQSFELNIKTRKENYHMKMNVCEKGFETYFGAERELKTTIKTFHVTLGEWTGWALVEMGHRNPHSATPVQTTREIPTETHFESGDCPSVLVTPFSSEFCRSGNVVGGKGLGLGLLTSLSDTRFSVPRGVCVTIKSYWQHLKQNPAIQKATKLVESIAWQTTEGNLKEECEGLMSAFKSTELNVSTQNAIIKEMKAIFGPSLDNISFAVRSSALGEDDKEISCAGQNDTFLGVKGLTKLWKAIIDCWASQFSYVAIEYKRQNGQLLDRGMGVVIQEMIPSDIAGVLFTADPVTGNTTTITITANYGLGQSVVSSSADPDTIVLERKSDNSLSIREKNFGKKLTKDVLNFDGGYTSVASSNEESTGCCLNETQIQLLGDVGLFVEQQLGHGGSLDIEWAISSSQLYLLQSRAITCLHQDNEFMLTHEFDSGLLTDNEPLTTANIGEVMPGALCPLTISITIRMLQVIQMARFQGVKSKVCKNIYSLGLIHVSERRSLGNFVNISPCGTMKEMTPMMKASGFGMIGKDIFSGTMHKTILHRYGGLDAKGSWVLAKPGFQYMFGQRRYISKTLKIFKAAETQLQVKSNDTPLDYYNRLSHLLTPIKRGFWVLMRGSTYSGMCASIILAILLHGQPDVTNEIMSDYALLLGSGNDVISAGVPKTLKTLAEKLNPDEFLSMSVQEADNWLSSSPDEPGKIYRSLLQEHGHRTYKEFDVRQQCWSEDPTPIINMLQSSLRSPPTTNTNQELTVEEAIGKLNTPMSSKQKMLLRKFLPICRKAVGAREIGKSICIQGINVHRKGCRNLSKLMVENGFLPEADLLYFLTLYEIRQLLTTRSPVLVNRAKRRKNIHPRLEQIRYPDFVCGYPEAVTSKQAPHLKDSDEKLPRDNEAKIFIKATTASHGCVKGKVRVITRIEDAPQIQPGEILITYSTDIGWSPYFPLLSGIVTEIGGIISHGAVIAREYGLPCLIAAENATKVFRSGEEVFLNATQGIIELVKDDSE